MIYKRRQQTHEEAIVSGRMCCEQRAVIPTGTAGTGLNTGESCERRHKTTDTRETETDNKKMEEERARVHCVMSENK